MYEKLSEKEIEFMEAFYDPVSLIENLIPENIDAPGTWDEHCKCIKIRNYQFAMLSYEYLYADDENLTPKQNFESKIGAGKIINIAARNIGKSYLGFDADATLTIIHYTGDESCIASFDDDHLTPRVNRISGLIDNHKFFEMFKVSGRKGTVSRKDGITTRNGHVMKKANENVTNKQKVGQQFHGMHYKKLFYDEYSYTTNKGNSMRADSKHSHGLIPRYFGIADIRVGSPLGKLMSDPNNAPFICRLPQYVRDDWDEETKAKAIENYDGESSDAYKLNVEAKLLQGASNKFDIEAIKKKCYTRTESVKYFEINKDNFDHFESIINIDRLPCEKVYVSSDLGFGGSPSEIIIIFDKGDKVKKRYKYVYQISIFDIRLPEEQAKVFAYIYDLLGSAFISVDCSEIGGKTVRQELIKLGIPEEHLSNFDFKFSDFSAGA